MKIKLKEELFISNSLQARTISQEEVSTLQIKGEKRFFNKTIFEIGVSLESPTISKGRDDIFIGAYSYMNQGGYIKSNVFIGRYCSIGRMVTIAAGMHNMTSVSTSPILKGIRTPPYNSEEINLLKPTPKKAPTIIENDVWIGDGVVILPGVRICTGAVIGANSVVTRDVEPYAIVGGVPAKFIRFRFPPQISEMLLKSEYWEHTPEVLNTAPLSNVFKFLSESSLPSHPTASFETFKINTATQQA